MIVIWDPTKARTNLRKHGVRFSDAEAALFDPNALTIDDQDAQGETRHVTVGLDSLARVVVLVFTYRGDDIRLISARRANRRERQHYESGL